MLRENQIHCSKELRRNYTDLKAWNMGGAVEKRIEYKERIRKGPVT